VLAFAAAAQRGESRQAGGPAISKCSGDEQRMFELLICLNIAVVAVIFELTSAKEDYRVSTQ